MTSWINNFLTPSQESLIATDGRKSTSLKLQEHGVQEELTRQPRRESELLRHMAEEDEEEARPPYLHVSPLV